MTEESALKKRSNNEISKAATPTITLKYYDGRGAAEVTRFLLAIAHVPYNDVRFSFDPVTYSSTDFTAAVENGELIMNMNRVPVLVYDDLTVGQSKTIERFIAKKFGFFGTNEAEEATIDAICESVRDIKQNYADARQGKSGDALVEARTSFLSEKLPKWLGKLEKCVGPDGFAVGASVSLADVSIFHLLFDHCVDLAAAAPKALEECPNLSAIASRVKPLLQDWLDSRPATMF